MSAFISWPSKEGTSHTALGADLQDRTQVELISHFADWELEVQQLLQCIEAPMRWAINVLDKLPLWVRGSVALMGDAVSWSFHIHLTTE